MIKISQVKMPVVHTEQELLQKAAAVLRVNQTAITELRILKKSVDARKKDDIHYSYVLAVALKQEEAYFKRNRDPKFTEYREKVYTLDREAIGEKRVRRPLFCRPVVVGSGPAGLFCAYLLARAGFAPLILERGAAMEERVLAAEHFFDIGILDPESNIQFGEGGAGTFSDGKLNTLVKDTEARSSFVLNTFVQFGAPSEILYMSKPHIGTDILRSVIHNMREEIIRMGGSFSFRSRLSDLRFENGRLAAATVVKTTAGGSTASELPCGLLVLAVGHSARDTFEMLKNRGFLLEQKPFAVGMRIEHLQEKINAAQYGAVRGLPPADYKLTCQTSSGRGVYTFCMCPGGYVVNASSEAGHTVVNGMSNHDRAGVNANSAVIVTVSPKDFSSESVLSGIEYQRELEAAAYLAGNGKIPVQLLGDFRQNQKSSSFGMVRPQAKGGTSFANLRQIWPEEFTAAFLEGMEQFDRKLAGFACEEAVLSGVESRTSSPVRIVRSENMQAKEGVYPCGEGAGYAGGIMSAAMDGMKTAEAVLKEYQN